MLMFIVYFLFVDRLTTKPAPSCVSAESYRGRCNIPAQPFNFLRAPMDADRVLTPFRTGESIVKVKTLHRSKNE